MRHGPRKTQLSYHDSAASAELT